MSERHLRRFFSCGGASKSGADDVIICRSGIRRHVGGQVEIATTGFVTEKVTLFKNIHFPGGINSQMVLLCVAPFSTTCPIYVQCQCSISACLRWQLSTLTYVKLDVAVLSYSGRVCVPQRVFYRSTALVRKFITYS